MWRALRIEFAYFRPFLLTAWGIAAGIAVLVNTLTWFSTSDDHPGSVLTAGLPGIFFVIAAMIVGFIAQGTRSEERRIRLLLAGPLTPRQLGGVLVLLPAGLVALGAGLGGVAVVVVGLVTGEFKPVPGLMVGGVAAQMLAVVQMGPLAQEATAARRQRRSRAANGGWAGFVVALLLLAGIQGIGPEALGMAAHVGVALGAMALSWTLFAARTDFTR